MNEPIKYISKVEIKNLWGRYDFEWNLDPEVNILSGINGSGKSTVLRCIGYATVVNILAEVLVTIIDSIVVKFNNGRTVELNENNSIHQNLLNNDNFHFDILKANLEISIIDTFDKPLNQNASPNVNVKTELDKDIFILQKQYLDYQLNIGKKAIEILKKNNKNISNEGLEVRKQHEHFIEIVDSLFANTDKKVDRDSNELMFLSGKDKLTPYQLSSGEKQILVILLTVLVQDNKPSILFLDEPEISLHLDWQRKLIQYIRELNPNVQIIIATHSPGIIMDGWMDKVFEMSDLITLDRKAKS